MSGLDLMQLEKMIYVIRGQKVMLDSDLAKLYGVETKILKRSVRRNIERFPKDFMFELTSAELQNWRCQFGTSNRDKMGLRISPFVFTEQGIAMLSSVLNSIKAVQINIAIMRIFMKLRSFLLLEKNLSERMNKLEGGTNQIFRIVFERLDKLEKGLPSLPSKRKRIGLDT
jgi:hypothetical protein